MAKQEAIATLRELLEQMMMGEEDAAFQAVVLIADGAYDGAEEIANRALDRIAKE